MVNQEVRKDLVGFVEREMGISFKMKMEGIERWMKKV